MSGFAGEVSWHGRQPAQGDWILGDIRLDAREELISACGLARETPDAEAVLAAWRKWGPRMMARVRGEFAFAIWDSAAGTVFAARDPMGTRPFYYGNGRGACIFSNSLARVRSHPSVANDLDESAIADFLLFGHNQNPATTSFRDIHRIPPGHFATLSQGGSKVERYWSVPEDEPLELASDQNYVEECCDVLRAAVRDRLPDGPVGVLMSGGLDSTSLAALVCDEATIPVVDVHAFTSDLRSRERDGEARYARETAEWLGIAHHTRWYDGELLDPAWAECDLATPEPCDSPTSLRFDRKYFAQLARRCNVFFFGEGPDNALLFEPVPYLKWLARSRGLPAAAAAIVSHARHHRRIPLAGMPGRFFGGPKGVDEGALDFPAWIEPGLVARLELKHRWREFAKRSQFPTGGVPGRRPRSNPPCGTTC